MLWLAAGAYGTQGLCLLYAAMRPTRERNVFPLAYDGVEVGPKGSPLLEHRTIVMALYDGVKR